MAAGLAGALLAGCGADPDADTNGVGKLSADEIQSRTAAAAKQAGTVRLSGSVVSQGGTYKLDMRLSENGGTGSVTAKGNTFQLLKVDDELYLKAGASFWKSEPGGDKGGSASAADKLDGKYVRVPQGDPAYDQFSGFTNMDVLVAGLLTLHGGLERGEHRTTKGVRSIEISGEGGEGGTLDVSLEGTPYPVLLRRAGGAGTLSFTEWDKPFPLKAPAKSDTVDYGEQLPTS